MHIHLADQYQQGTTFVHRLDPRTKVSLVVLFILAAGLSPFGAFDAYVLLLAAVIFIASLSGISFRYLLKRSFIALPFALAAVTLPFTVPGQTWATIPLLGGITVTIEGTVRFLSILIKSWISVQMAILLVSLTPFPDMMWALQALHIPKPLVAISDRPRSRRDSRRSSRTRPSPFSDGAAVAGAASGWESGALAGRLDRRRPSAGAGASTLAGTSARTSSRAGAEAALTLGDPPGCAAEMAAISSPLRILPVPVMPNPAAMVCSSGSSLADRPLPAARRRRPVEASSATWETSDVMSVVSLNGFLPSIGRGCPGLRNSRWRPGGLGYTRRAR
jgi:hypothetical protein